MKNIKQQNSYLIEDNLQVWLDIDLKYKKSKNLGLKSLYKTFKDEQIMSKNYFNQILFYLTKHAAATIILGLILTTGISVSAAELFAPEEYRPSQVIKKFTYSQNQQTDKNPYTALKPDESNDVVNFDECGLAIKYPKKIDNEENFLSYGSRFGQNSDLQSPISGVSLGLAFAIDCYNKSDLLITNQISDVNTSLLQNIKSIVTGPKVYADSAPPEEFALKPVSKDDFYDITGWFVLEAELSDMYEIESFNDFKVDKEKEKCIRFTHQNKTYITYFRTEGYQKIDDYDSSLASNKIQVQLNSLVESQSNADIKSEQKRP
jgi:hypothetical protein